MKVGKETHDDEICWIKDKNRNIITRKELQTKRAEENNKSDIVEDEKRIIYIHMRTPEHLNIIKRTAINEKLLNDYYDQSIITFLT